MTWARRFNVRGRSGDPYTVAFATNGTWGCSCPKWKFAKKVNGEKPDCHHIEAVRDGAMMPNENRAAGLDIDQRAPARSPRLPDLGARFRHLDMDIEVTA